MQCDFILRQDGLSCLLFLYFCLLDEMKNEKVARQLIFLFLHIYQLYSR